MIPFRVYLVRHGDAEAADGGGDSARRLSPEGKRRFTALVKALTSEMRLSRILTSPLVRARETADLLALATGVIVEEEPSLAPGRSTGSDLLRMAALAGSGVALVCHNPELAEAVTLASDEPRRMTPGMVAAVDVTDGDYRLAWVREA
jgi:phosphohistidine phosphatase